MVVTVWGRTGSTTASPVGEVTPHSSPVALSTLLSPQQWKVSHSLNIDLSDLETWRLGHVLSGIILVR